MCDTVTIYFCSGTPVIECISLNFCLRDTVKTNIERDKIIVVYLISQPQRKCQCKRKRGIT